MTRARNVAKVCVTALTLLTSAWVFAVANPRAATSVPTPTKTAAIPSFPKNFDYPQPAAVVEKWVSTPPDGNQRRIREHGWYLWAGLNTPSVGGRPVWRTWPTSTQAFAPPSTELGATEQRVMSINDRNHANGRSDVPEPINFPSAPKYPIPQLVKDRYPGCVVSANGSDTLRDGPTFQFNGDVMVAGVIYDGGAFNTIRDRSLFSATVLTGQVPKKPTDPPNAIKEFPHDAIVLKPMLWPVKGRGYTALPVWDDLPPSADQGQYIGFEIVGTKEHPKWWRAVAITAERPRPSKATVTYLHHVTYAPPGSKNQQPLGPNTYDDAPVVPITDFYAFRFTRGELKRMNACDRAILDASAIWAFDRPFQAGDYLVVIAMHIITKEQPAWTFQSVWWHDRPDAGPYAANRPAHIAGAVGPWRHYLLTSTYGTTQPNDPKKLPVAFNPYIELAADHPIATNCMNCHHRAAWPQSKASYLATGAGAPGPLDVFSVDNAIFDGSVTVDSLWSVSDRAN